MHNNLQTNLTANCTYSSDSHYFGCENKENFEENKMIDVILNILSGIVLPIYVFFGLISNCHVVYVFLVKISNPSRQMVYLSCLAIADNLNLVVSGVIFTFGFFGLPYLSSGSLNFGLHNLQECSYMVTLRAFTSCFACSMFVLLCLDRLLSIYQPMKLRLWSRKRAWILSGLTFIFSLGIALPFLWVTRMLVNKDSTERCTLIKNLFWMIYMVMFTNCGILQSSVVLLINLALVIKLQFIHKDRGSLSESSCNRLRNSSTLSRSEINATALIIVLSCLFVTCALPQGIFLTLSTYNYSFQTEIHFHTLLVYQSISDILWIPYFLQESINWVIYYWRMPVFRRECQACFRRGGILVNQTDNISL